MNPFPFAFPNNPNPNPFPLVGGGGGAGGLTTAGNTAGDVLPLPLPLLGLPAGLEITPGVGGALCAKHHCRTKAAYELSDGPSFPPPVPVPVPVFPVVVVVGSCTGLCG